MKKLLTYLVLSFTLAVGTTAFAAPFVVSDSFQADVVDVCIITVDGSSSEMSASSTGTNEARCVYDVESVSDGSHTITMATKNVWGVSEPVPFNFTKTLPPVLTNLHLEE
jgi:hypothetical protein